jgi:hypothetical protein
MILNCPAALHTGQAMRNTPYSLRRISYSKMHFRFSHCVASNCQLPLQISELERVEGHEPKNPITATSGASWNFQYLIDFSFSGCKAQPSACY